MPDPGPITPGLSCGDCVRLDRCRMEHWQDPQSLTCRFDPPLFEARRRFVFNPDFQHLADLPIPAAPLSEFQTCLACEMAYYPPGDVCPECGADQQDCRDQENCGGCEGGGWKCTAHPTTGGPSFYECDDCHNPKGLPCP